MDHIWVEGEVTSIKRRPNAKTQYFQLADLTARPQITIPVKIWSHALPVSIREGMNVVIWAKPDFWERNGSFTLHADAIQQVGLGDILARLEALKAQFASEGLFAASRKKALPFLPHTIGLICGRNTEAEKDVVVNACARWPEVNFAIRQVQVQGDGAVPAMLEALAELDSHPTVDVIVFARGGGSPEDLLPFSDERLVRAAASAATPIVSAIGHEADNPILDYVADVRASTPTDAARRIVPDVFEERRSLAADLARGRHAISTHVSLAEHELMQLRSRPALSQPELFIDGRAQEVAHLSAWGRTYIDSAMREHAATLASQLAHLRTLSPLSTLKRGYSIVRDDDGYLVSSTKQTHQGHQLHVLMYEGGLRVTVNELSDEKIGEERSAAA